jgi:GNAT superfamily N-acetyltransferase
MQGTTMATAIYGFNKNLPRFFSLRRPAVPEFVSFGWAALSAWKSRCAYARSVEASVYIRHDLHRRGLGRALMLDLIERAQAAGHHTIHRRSLHRAGRQSGVAGVAWVRAGRMLQGGRL